jgi:nitrate/nitrite transporter NarK
MEVLIPLFAITAIAFVAIIHTIVRHRERINIIEKGLSNEDIKALYSRQFAKSDPLASLKWGMLFTFGGLAVLVGNFLHEQYRMEEGATLGLVALFVGIALVIFYGIAGKNPKPPAP